MELGVRTEVQFSFVVRDARCCVRCPSLAPHHRSLACTIDPTLHQVKQKRYVGWHGFWGRRTGQSRVDGLKVLEVLPFHTQTRNPTPSHPAGDRRANDFPGRGLGTPPLIGAVLSMSASGSVPTPLGTTPSSGQWLSG